MPEEISLVKVVWASWAWVRPVEVRTASVNEGRGVSRVRVI